MEFNRKKVERILMTVAGNVLYAAGVNLMINPIHLYSGGFTGIAQLIRLFLIGFLHIPEIPGLDYMGIIYFAINIPLFFMAYKVMGRKFCITTLISIAMASAFLAVIPVPAVPIVDDRILASVVGGLGSGVGAGLVLRAGSSQGGQDVIGVCLAKTHPNFKVGTIGIIISVCIYTICLFIYDIPTVLYSVIFAVVTGLGIDRVHVQNIKQECMIFTKKPGLRDAILHDLNRGVTIWEGEGGYTGENTQVLVTVISKYEEPHLREIIARHDENAFMIISDNIRVVGLFQKRFTE
ncbi:MAG: YitT family protein [Mogibacterium sp.]|nr:YitT family protein [Mogibacterium sp.]MBR3331713.1 YitT family protein [Mogibacterium sp.]MBR4091001.1 YitT family protein [Mogibacterium sp.]